MTDKDRYAYKFAIDKFSENMQRGGVVNKPASIQVQKDGGVINLVLERKGLKNMVNSFSAVPDVNPDKIPLREIFKLEQMATECAKRQGQIVRPKSKF
jgi:hypothetical protein